MQAANDWLGKWLGDPPDLTPVIREAQCDCLAKRLDQRGPTRVILDYFFTNFNIVATKISATLRDFPISFEVGKSCNNLKACFPVEER